MAGGPGLASSLSRLPASATAPRKRPEENAATSPLHFTLLVAQIAALAAMFWLLPDRLRPYPPRFPTIFTVAAVAFCAHYWLPFSLKQPCWLLLSVAGLFIVRDVPSAIAVVMIAMVLYGVSAIRVPRWYTITLVLVCVATLLAVAAFMNARGRSAHGVFLTIGGMFALRGLIYWYERAHSDERPGFVEYVRYFFILPNFSFPFFPVLDLRGLRLSYYRRESYRMAQEGIGLMCLGIAQLLMVVATAPWRRTFGHAQVHSLGALLVHLGLYIVLYFRVSGPFHLCIGLMRCFGYDLAPSHRWFLLSRGPLDLWRRTNTYWREMLEKVVYFPVYFKLRRRSDRLAQVIGMVILFAVSWVLHPWNFMWLADLRRPFWSFLRASQGLQWTLLGGATIVALVFGWRRDRVRPTGAKPSPVRAYAVAAFQIVAMWFFMGALWSLEEAPNTATWARMFLCR
jgi:hypothetical protein